MDKQGLGMHKFAEMAAFLKVATQLEKAGEKVAGDLERIKEEVLLPENEGERINAYKEEVGEENFKIIASGPNLADMMKEWEKAKILKLHKMLSDTIEKNLPEGHGCTKKDIDSFLVFTLENEAIINDHVAKAKAKLEGSQNDTEV